MKGPMMRESRYRFQGRTMPEPGRRQPLSALTAVDSAEGEATIRVYDFIDSWGGEWGISAREFAEVLDGLDESVGTIRLHINSGGGEVFEAIAIINLLRAHRARIVSTVDGLAASAASLLAVAADEVVMSPNTELMIHDAWGLCMGNAADMREFAALLDHLSDNGAGIYAAKAGGTTAEWRELMLAETWFSADEAVAAGLADRIAEPGTAPQNRVDVTSLGFRYPGRAAAPAPAARSGSLAPVRTAQAGTDAQRELDRRRHEMNARRVAARI